MARSIDWTDEARADIRALDRPTAIEAKRVSWPRRFQSRLGKLKSVDDTLPLDLWLLEIDEQTQSSARGSQIVKTLGGVFVGHGALGTFQLDDQHILHQNVSKVLSDDIVLIRY